MIELDAKTSEADLNADQAAVNQEKQDYQHYLQKDEQGYEMDPQARCLQSLEYEVPQRSSHYHFCHPSTSIISILRKNHDHVRLSAKAINCSHVRGAKVSGGKHILKEAFNMI